uniref:Uncharacterized protein n=1 Tax=Marseillevirus LCMAC101 TaxID=2506602 RepID=A0A481YSD9_9VIRU|nr:MAG: uncharacterized protein LCMAC101_04750 [Marseillevirus LCMAC101]
MGEFMGGFGGWYITHFIFFYIIGLLFPDCMLLAMTLGALFEIIESVTAPILFSDRAPFPDMQYTRWDGTPIDLLFNFTGFVAGMLTTKYFLNGKPPKVPWVSADSEISKAHRENYKNGNEN